MYENCMKTKISNINSNIFIIQSYKPESSNITIVLIFYTITYSSNGSEGYEAKSPKDSA